MKTLPTLDGVEIDRELLLINRSITSLIEALRCLGQRLQTEEVTVPKPTWILHLASKTLVAPNGQAVMLTRGETRFLHQLFTAPGGLLRHAAINGSKAGLGVRATNQAAASTLVLISRLRRKCATFNADPPIRLVRGWGYSFSQKALVQQTQSSAKKRIRS